MFVHDGSSETAEDFVKESRMNPLRNALCEGMIAGRTSHNLCHALFLGMNINLRPQVV